MAVGGSHLFSQFLWIYYQNKNISHKNFEIKILKFDLKEFQKEFTNRDFLIIDVYLIIYIILKLDIYTFPIR